MGYLCLSQVITMVLLVVWLFVETKRAVDRERRSRQDGKVTHTLVRERCTYAIISTLFGLSYIGRFVLNTYIDCEVNESPFVLQMTVVSVFLLEGSSMGVLMLFHCINFKHGSLLASKRRKERDVSYIAIMPGEYHFFSDESVDAHSLADKSSNSHSLAGKSSYII